MRKDSRPRRDILVAAFYALLLVAVLLLWPRGAGAVNSNGLRAVPTYESVGLYWAKPPGAGSGGCQVRYRAVGVPAWSDGLPLWYDARNDECRGSLVHLRPGTLYEAQLNVAGSNTRRIQFSTWPQQMPIAKVILVPGGGGTLTIAEGGSPTGYVLYQGMAGAVLDAQNAYLYNVDINASYVIVRGLTMVGAQKDAIRISPDVSDVVIEDNDISGWGRPRNATSTLGMHMDSGIRAFCGAGPTLQRVTIQRNKIHDPRWPSHYFGDDVAPGGPQAITFSHCGGNHVIRHNEMYSTNGNYFFDIIGGEDNFTDRGFPYADTDIHSNKLMHSYDDAIEAEGKNMNVRIWGNYLDRNGVGIATTITATGPVYIFRNVWNRNRFYPQLPPDQDQRQPFFKSGSCPVTHPACPWAPFGHGRRYVFHNTMLQAEDPAALYTLGGGHGLGGSRDDQPVVNTLSMNNIYHLWNKGTPSTFFQIGNDTQAVNDMTSGTIGASFPVTNLIFAAPTYEEGNGWKSESGGQYALKSGTPGYDQGARIANFNDGFAGAAPDVGAHEAGSGNMKFGKESAFLPYYILGTLTASANPVVQSQSVTLSASFWGTSETPTGTVQFKDGSGTIQGCGAVTLADGVATCTTTFQQHGTHTIEGHYSGGGSYGATATAPLTLTVNKK